MQKYLFLLLVLLVVGCNNAAPLEKSSSNNGWQVELCFEKEGYRVYRFSDGNDSWRYYVTPTGTMIDNVKKGKHTVQEEITTVGEENLER